MIGNALALAILTTSGFLVIYLKLPERIKLFLEKHSLFTDALALITTYVLLGGTLTALIAAALCGLFVSGLLYIARNKEDFLYLNDIYDYMKTQLKQFQIYLSDYGKKYKLKKRE